MKSTDTCPQSTEYYYIIIHTNAMNAPDESILQITEPILISSDDGGLWEQSRIYVLSLSNHFIGNDMLTRRSKDRSFIFFTAIQSATAPQLRLAGMPRDVCFWGRRTYFCTSDRG